MLPILEKTTIRIYIYIYILCAHLKQGRVAYKKGVFRMKHSPMSQFGIPRLDATRIGKPHPSHVITCYLLSLDISIHTFGD